jgi:hypothetical protein
MSIFRFSVATAVTVGLAGCLPDGNEAPPTTYEYVAPPVGFARNYRQTIIDNEGNTINETFSETVTTVNSDGSYVVLQEDTTGSSPVVDGTTYTIPTETIEFNNESQETSYTALEANGTVESCTYDPNGAGPGYPLTVGNSWTLTYTLTCGTAAPVEYTQTGNVLDVESVTVPAGTYTAIKLQSTISWTTASGTSITQTITNWRDIDTLFSVQQNITRVYGGTLPATGYEVSETIQLTSEN